MGIKGIIFITIALLGVILNFSSRFVSGRTNIPEIKIKLTALAVVFIAVSLLFIFGK